MLLVILEQPEDSMVKDTQQKAQWVNGLLRTLIEKIYNIFSGLPEFAFDREALIQAFTINHN